MGKGGAGNNSGEDYRMKGRDTIPYSRESAYFQAEGDDVTDLAFFLGQFGEEDGELSLNEYWSDPKTGFQSETVGPTTGRALGGAIGERLDEFSDSGYNVSVYDFEDDGFEVTAGVSEDLPRSFTERIGGISPEVNHADGGLTVRGNLDVSPDEIYESARVADVDEARIWPKVDSSFRRLNDIVLR
jgi:hypothetical protein